MPYTNLNHDFTPEHRETMTECFTTLMEMMEFGVNLTPEERMEMQPRHGSEAPFLDSVFTRHGNDHREYRPSFLDFDESCKDYELYNDMMAMETMCRRLLECISDTRMAAGHEARTYALTYYDMCHKAAQEGDANARRIWEELKRHFSLNGDNHEGHAPDGIDRAA